MKNFGSSSWLAFGGVFLAVAWLFTATAQAAQPGVAQVKKVVGTATYTDARGGGPLKEGDILMQGATITTGARSYVDLNLGVNGNALRVDADSTLALNKLDYTTAGETIVNTELEVKKGAAVANVINKLSKASKYEIKTAAGVAGIRGTCLEATTTKITCLIGTISFVPVAGGGVQIVINGGNSFTAGSLNAVKAGSAEINNLATKATGLTVNTVAANAVANTVAQFTAAIAADKATDAAKTGGADAAAKAAADTAKQVMADLVKAVTDAAKDASPAVKDAINAVVANLIKNSDAIATDAAAKGAGIAIKVTGGSDAQAQQAAKAAANQTTTNPTVANTAVANATGVIANAQANANPTVVVDNNTSKTTTTTTTTTTTGTTTTTVNNKSGDTTIFVSPTR